MVDRQDDEGAVPSPGPLRRHQGEGQGVAAAGEGDGQGRPGAGVEAGVQTRADPVLEGRGQPAHRDWADTAAARFRVPSGAAG